MFVPVDIIKKKRDHGQLSANEIKEFILKYTSGEVADYQMSALLMAIALNGMDFRETLDLTNTMLHSGEVVDFSNVEGVKVDKHSTGGVGDKTSIILAPVAAACGVKIPMISGRGLGHTGGTLDKLESIPGFNVNLTLEQFKKMIETHGISLIGQTQEIAPADKKIYALRDVTGTVESIPLITASIMSKKLAEGIDGLVLDIKTGNGAFMSTLENARSLANMLVKVGNLAGKKVVGIITDMNRPLGKNIGNWLEIRECIDCLHGHGDARLMELSLTLAALMVLIANKAETFSAAYKKCEQVIADGSAYEKLVEITRLHGGDEHVIHHPENYPTAQNVVEVRASGNGTVEDINALTLGKLSVVLGAGRMKKEDPVDAQAGIVIKKAPGDAVQKEDVLCELHTNKDVLPEYEEQAASAFSIGTSKPDSQPLIYELVTENGIYSWQDIHKILG